MKHLIAIFSVILTLGTIAPGVYAEDRCPKSPSSGNPVNDRDILVGNKYHFRCGDGCNKGMYLATTGSITRQGRILQGTTGFKVWVCYCVYDSIITSMIYDYRWNNVSSSFEQCFDSNFAPGKVVRVKDTNGDFKDFAPSCVNNNCAIEMEMGDCVGWFCKDGYTWDATQNKCVSPDAQDSAHCEASGGTWANGECKCNETTLTQRPDKKTCVANAKYTKCEDSGGDWNSSNNTCTCGSNKGLDGPNWNDECFCKDTSETYSKQDNKCVPTAQAVCENSGGTWSDTALQCTCERDKNVVDVSGSRPQRCKCKDDDYELDADPSNGCVLTGTAQQTLKDYDAFKTNCEKWVDASWVPGADATDDAKLDQTKWQCTQCEKKTGRIQENDKLSCTCDGANGYVQDPLYQCRQTAYAEAKQNCEVAKSGDANVSWVELGNAHGSQVGECKCNNPNQNYVFATKKCEDGVKVQWCNLIYGAIIGLDGRCVCKSTRLPPVNNQCPVADGATSGSNESSVNAVAAAEQKKQQVANISKKLTEISNGFDRSHWKNADGGFNTARLASDSVAGVVLGTVGGVVTSNIIKKNQVKSGFENLNCAVGGQMVADYGDQFQVGIR